MKLKFTSKQVTTMVVAICLAAIFTPVAVYATGQLVTIVDTANRSAKVSTNGALLVENRAFPGSRGFNFRNSRYQFGWISLASVTGPTRLAITELTLAGNYDPVGGAAEVLVEALVRTSGSAPCEGPGSSGYVRHTLKHVWVPVRQSIQLRWDGQPLVLPIPDSGQPMCFGVTYYAGNTNLTVYADGTGYRFE
jgi:hypothetical protein